MTGDATRNGTGPQRTGREPMARPLPKRFYENALAGPVEGGFGVLLDGRAARTPAKRLLTVASPDLAEVIAAEWAAQTTTIDPATMPLTRIVIAAVDGVAGNERAVAEDIVAFAGSDLVCYRAAAPSGLVAAQSAHWDPVLAWAEGRLHARMRLAEGVMHVAQDAAALDAVRRHLVGRDALALAALHVMTTLTGSALIALAHADGAMDVAAAWAAAHVDEDWQISQWGEDGEARARRARRWLDMQAASRIAALTG
ncbi:MAG: ATP12 family chaperone protein [Hyphomicrobiaceae bacterium]